MTLTELKGRYKSLDKIKRGGQKTVYKAMCEDGSCYALKIITNVDDARVKQEIELAHLIDNNHIPKIIDSGIIEDTDIAENVLFIVEEFIHGVSLRDWLNQGNKFSLKQAIDLLDVLIHIEVELEASGIIHRDINPNNIILGNDGMTYLIDFGLARILSNPSLTLTGAAFGPFTPGYAPHEQFNNKKLEQDTRTDLFQIGVTIYEACSGMNPFVKKGATYLEIMSRTMTEIPPKILYDGDLKGMFSQFIDILMANNQSQRPDTAVDALRYLNAIKPTLSLEE